MAPKNRTGHPALDQGVAALEKADYDLAVSRFTEAIRLKPDCAKAYYNRGVAPRSPLARANGSHGGKTPREGNFGEKRLQKGYILIRGDF